MRRAFTELVRSLEPGGEPFPAGFDIAWKKLQDTLIGELRRRSLWNAPPSYLGIHGGSRWTDPGALEELTSDCFLSVFVHRLATLKALLEKMDNVEGLVFRNVRNFLHDTQKKHNPLDFKVFEVLRTSIRRSIETGELYVLGGDVKIRNSTILGFGPGDDPATAAVNLSEHVRPWSHELLPELVTSRPSEQVVVVERLCGCLARLAGQGIVVFRFKEVVDALKGGVRAHWCAVWQQGEGSMAIENSAQDFVHVVRLVRPDSGFEERQFFSKLIACVSEALPNTGKTRKTRRHLQRLWMFLRIHAAQPSTDRLPAQRKIGELLGIPRKRIPEFLEILGGVVERCQAAAGTVGLES
ncbi:MAG: hypothetical protein V3T72_05310 [Thermoanaerobaculia bacterium]